MLAARIAADALAGLAYIHDATSYDGTALGLVHRDVSPQNLFITYDGQVKLLDFGIAKVTAVMTAEQTQPGLVKGKLGYIAPEQASGQVDRRADVWSTGVVLWEALIGRPLFRGDSDVEKLRAMLNEAIPAVRSLRADVPPALAQIVARALQRERAQRYASAAEMKAAIDAWLSTQAERGALPAAPDEAVGRRMLASAMQTRFSDAISERRAAVSECLAAVEHAPPRFRSSETDLPVSASIPVSAPLRTSVPTRVPGETPQHAGQERVKRSAVLALVLAAGAALLVLAVVRNASPAPPVSARAPEGALRPASLPASKLATEQVRAALPARAAEPAKAALSAAPLGSASGAAVAAVAKPAARATRASARPPARSALPAPISARAPEGALRPEPRAEPRVSSASTKPQPEPLSSAAREQESAPAQARAEDSEHVTPTSGRLRLDASPYAVVSLAGRRLGMAVGRLDQHADVEPGRAEAPPYTQSKDALAGVPPQCGTGRCSAGWCCVGSADATSRGSR